MAQFVLFVRVVIWSVLHATAIGSRSMSLQVHVLGSCSCKMALSVRAPLHANA